MKLLGRRPNTLTRFLRRGAEVVIGSQDDAKYLTRATLDADALFWVTPPGYGSDNVRAFQNRLAQAVGVHGQHVEVSLDEDGASAAAHGLLGQVQADQVCVYNFQATPWAVISGHVRDEQGQIVGLF